MTPCGTSRVERGRGSLVQRVSILDHGHGISRSTLKKVKVPKNGYSTRARLARRLLGSFRYPFPISLYLILLQKLVKTLTFVCMFLFIFSIWRGLNFSYKRTLKNTHKNIELLLSFIAYTLSL